MRLLMHLKHTLVAIVMALGMLIMMSSADAQEVQRKEQGGIAVEYSLVNGLTQLSFKDANTGRPLNGLRPAAWLMAQRSSQVSKEISCEAKAQQLSSGSLGSRADVDLNSYRLITLNQDNTIAFINPHVSLKNTKLESIVQLPGRGYDWVYLPRQHKLVITLRDDHAVVVIDTTTRRLAGRIDFSDGSLPTRIVADNSGSYLWVGLDGKAEVVAIDVDTFREHTRVAVGSGLHTLAVSPKSPWLQSK
jgi:DNA-binding beta-propeller fold protein YncE